MSTLREAAQQALEALGCIEYGINGIEYGPSDDTTESAITALRAALEQHEKDVGWMKQRHANWRLQKELVEQTQERDRQRQEYEEVRMAELEPERTLTDEVIADLWHQNGGFHHHFARAVERYLKGEK
jgi:hypothetical protein